MPQTSKLPSRGAWTLIEATTSKQCPRQSCTWNCNLACLAVLRLLGRALRKNRPNPGAMFKALRKSAALLPVPSAPFPDVCDSASAPVSLPGCFCAELMQLLRKCWLRCDRSRDFECQTFFVCSLCRARSDGSEVMVVGTFGLLISSLPKANLACR